MTYKVLSCGTPLQGNAEAGKVIAEGKVQLPSINPGETGTARFELPDSFRKGDVLELEFHCLLLLRITIVIRKEDYSYAK